LSRGAPPFKRGLGHPCLREVMRKQRRLGCGGVGKLIAQSLGRTAVQGLATAPKQILVGSILNKRVFKAII